MEIVLNSNFSEISYNEMELIEGGGVEWQRKKLSGWL